MRRDTWPYRESNEQIQFPLISFIILFVQNESPQYNANESNKRVD